MNSNLEHTWPSCGHTAMGTCLSCYIERGRRLAKAEQEVERLRAGLARIGDRRLGHALKHVDELRRIAVDNGLSSDMDLSWIDRYAGWLLMVKEIVEAPSVFPYDPGQ